MPIRPPQSETSIATLRLDITDGAIQPQSTFSVSHRYFTDGLAIRPTFYATTGYIPYGEDIEAFLKREIAKPIIRWKDSSQLGYEILPNKYFYRYQPPTPAKELLAEFWRLEKEAEKMLQGFGQ